jgi:hypothetical protein
MNDHTYILDIKNIKEEAKFSALFGDAIEKHSDRVFSFTGRELINSDYLKIWLLLGRDGHIFSYDCQTTAEFYRQRNPKGRTLSVAPDQYLDSLTLHMIGSVQEALEDQS